MSKTRKLGFGLGDLGYVGDCVGQSYHGVVRVVQVVLRVRGGVRGVELDVVEGDGRRVLDSRRLAPGLAAWVSNEHRV